MNNATINYLGHDLQTAQANGAWICFVDCNDPLLPIMATEALALEQAKRFVRSKL
jgi:hypothetical protein